MNLIFLSGLILGLSSSFHCIGMCGPIAMAIPLNRGNTVTTISGILQYNAGRVLMYAFIGALVGSIGLSINTLGFLQWMSIITGAFLILFAWRKYLSRLLPTFHVNNGIGRFTSRQLTKVMRSGSPFKLFLLGSLNGMLPCGMVFVGLTNAVLGGGIFSGAVAMALFGLGTIPSMFAVTFLANKMAPAIRSNMNRSIPYLLSLVGILVMLRGMNLNIPYLSPAVQVVNTENNKNSPVNEQVEMSCCHSSDNCK